MSAVNEQQYNIVPKLLITRPSESGKVFGERLLSVCSDIHTLYMPVIEIEYLDIDLNNIDADVSLILTSKHARKAADHLSNNIYEINPSKGISDASELLHHIETTHDKSKLLLYLRGRDVTMDIASALKAKGFKVEERISYIAHAAEALSDEVIDALKNKQLGYISFFSPRSARIFEDLVKKANLQGSIESVSALCLSTQVVNSLTVLPWKKRLVTAAKHGDAMVDLIKTLYSK